MTVTTAKLHLVYSLLLAHCFSLAVEDQTAIWKEWQCAARGDEGTDVAWPTLTGRTLAECEPQPIKMCSMPSEFEKLEACRALSEILDLSAVPGFYQDPAALPGPEGLLRRELNEDFSPWRINLPLVCAECGEFARGSVCAKCEGGPTKKRTRRRSSNALLVPYDNGLGLIVGIRVYRSVKDRHPFLLSSRGLPCGAPAIPFTSTSCFSDPRWASAAASAGNPLAGTLGPGDMVREVSTQDALDGVVVSIVEGTGFLKVLWANHDHAALVARDQVVGV